MTKEELDAIRKDMEKLSKIAKRPLGGNPPSPEREVYDLSVIKAREKIKAKEKTCPECKGLGIPISNNPGVYTPPVCPNCKGTGIIKEIKSEEA